MAISEAEDFQPVVGGLAQYVDNERLLACEQLMRTATPKRVMQIKTAALFHRIDPDPSKIREDYQMSQRHTGKEADIFSDSFSLTQEPDGRPVEKEFKMEIALFMMDALLALDTYGFVPWKVTSIVSQMYPGKVIKVLRVPKFGLWRVRQTSLPGDRMETIYQLQPYRTLATAGVNTGLLSDPARFRDETETNQAGVAFRQALGTTASQQRQPAAKELQLGLTNAARDLDALDPLSKKTHGIYVVFEPTTNGIPSSPAMTAVPYNQLMNQYWKCGTSAITMGAIPPLITGPSTTGDKQPAVNAATSFLQKGDVARIQAEQRANADARMLSLTRQNDQAQALSAAEREAAQVLFYDTFTHQKMSLRPTQVFDNHILLRAGEQVHTAPMPKEPQSLEAKQRAVDELTAALLGVPFQIAFLGEHGSLAGGAEQNQEVLDQFVTLQGNMLAQLTEWILNHVFHDEDTQIYQKEASAQTELVQALRDRDEEYVTSDNDTEKDRNRRLDEIKSAQGRLDYLNQIIHTPNRYRVRFPNKAPSLEAIQTMVSRGLIERKTEAALTAASLGVPLELVQLQAGPSKFDKASLTAAAEAKATGAEKRPSGSKDSKPKKQK